MMTMLILSGIFFILSVPLLMGKGSWLIAGYNTFSRKVKEKYNEKKLCRTVGLMCLCLAILSVIFAIINNETYIPIYNAFFFLICLISFLYSNLKCYK